MDKKVREKLEVIHVNCYKLFLCNNELKFLFEKASSEELLIFRNNTYLRFSIDSIHINFCILTSILINENEEYSITKVIKENINDSELKRTIWNTIYNYNFQSSWQKIKKLRNKCYAHNDKQVEEIKKEIQLTQHERNIICEGLTYCIRIIYSKLLDTQIICFNPNEKSNISKQIKMIKEWNEFINHETLNKIQAPKTVPVEPYKPTPPKK